MYICTYVHVYDTIMNVTDLLSILGSHPNRVSGERGEGGVRALSWSRLVAGAFSWSIADGQDTRGVNLRRYTIKSINEPQLH